MNSIFSTEHLASLPHRTPFFVCSKKQIADKYAEYVRTFPNADIFYAMKANGEREVLEVLRDAGSSFEVASHYELRMLKEVGIPPEKITFGTSVKAAAQIREFAEYGVDLFACDSAQELEKVAANAPKSRVYIRVVVDQTGSVFKLSEKFGTDREHVVQLLVHARSLGLVPYGISFHVGSQASNVHAWAHALDYLAPVLTELQSFGITLHVINIGGGFPHRYPSFEAQVTLSEIAESMYEAYHRLAYQPRLMLEPGRGIVAEGFALVSEVIGRAERSEHTWLYLDAGVYSGLFESMAYQGSTRYAVTSLRPSYDTGLVPFALAGPTGDSPDVITREAFLPPDLNTGDRVVFHDVGAYSFVAICPYFHGYPKPPVYYFD